METRFAVNQKAIMNILASMQPICTKRTTIDATSYILFNVGHKELVLKATDLEISLQSSYVLEEGGVDEPTSFLVPGKRLFDLVKELDGVIEFQVTDQQVTLKAGRVNLALHIKDAQEFPPFPERIENMMQFDASFLLKQLNNVSFLIPQNNANPALNGLFLEIAPTGLMMTTTDGHCLAQVSAAQYTLDEPRRWLLPRRAVFEVKRLLESSEDQVVFLGTCGNQLVFSGAFFNFFSRLLADPFPSYDAILNKEGFMAATVDRGQLLKTLRRSACLLSGQFIATQFGFETDKVHVSMTNKEVGQLEEEISLVQFEGAKLDIRFFAPYLLNGLQVFPEEKITFFLKGSINPVIFESTENDTRLLYLVMPVSATHNAN
jgi:DNA polymerase III subunit beta